MVFSGQTCLGDYQRLAQLSDQKLVLIRFALSTDVSQAKEVNNDLVWSGRLRVHGMFRPLLRASCKRPGAVGIDLRIAMRVRLGRSRRLYASGAPANAILDCLK